MSQIPPLIAAEIVHRHRRELELRIKRVEAAIRWWDTWNEGRSAGLRPETSAIARSAGEPPGLSREALCELLDALSADLAELQRVQHAVPERPGGGPAEHPQRHAPPLGARTGACGSERAG